MSYYINLNLESQFRLGFNLQGPLNGSHALNLNVWMIVHGAVMLVNQRSGVTVFIEGAMLDPIHVSYNNSPKEVS